MKVPPKSSRTGKACSNTSDIPDENGCGIPGGIFAPSLATGAGFEASLAEWLPGYPVGVVVILGMVSYFTGVVQTPITAFVIVMEMTDNSGLVLPLMATAFIAHVSSRSVCPEPLYRTLAQSFMPGKKV